MALNPSIGLGYVSCSNPTGASGATRIVFWNLDAVDSTSVTFTLLNKGFGSARYLAVDQTTDTVYLSTDAGIIFFPYEPTVRTL
jgi:hypothetical protein